MLVTRCCVLDNVTVYAADDVIFCLFQMTSLDQTGVSLVVLTKKLAWVAEVGEQVYQLLR